MFHVHHSLLIIVALSTPLHAGDNDLPAWQRRAQTSLERGLAFLASTQQPDGGWTLRSGSDPAITAMAAKCFIQYPKFGPQHPIARRAIKFILGHVQPDGGIYIPDQGMRNYYTSVCLMALAATRDKSHAETIARAQAFLKKGQWDEDEDHDRKSVWYGGAGYGKHKRPDLSNTQMMLEALKQSGLDQSDPVYQKALVFITRSQMSTESNDQSFVFGAADGGFIYTPANGGESKAGTELVNGKPRLRTYGSMTYAGFKSLLYAGLSHKDPRVRSAYAWIRNHYTLDENPNMPGAKSKQGLFYYYHVFARALDAWGDDMLIDARGVEHPWRMELCDKLGRMQRQDGSWINPADRWYESNPNLVTAYAILAIQTAAR
jgi:squalene-hopene/tetraprenyl-beta-curcumene cyclase